MFIYNYLIEKTNPAIARMGTALWYALLIMAIVFCVFEPQAEFRYGYL